MATKWYVELFVGEEVLHLGEPFLRNRKSGGNEPRISPCKMDKENITMRIKAVKD